MAGSSSSAVRLTNTRLGGVARDSDAAGKTVQTLLLFLFMVCLSAGVGIILRPVYWQLYATANPMKDTLPKGSVSYADEADEVMVPRSEEAMADVVLTAASEEGSGADTEAARDEATRALNAGGGGGGGGGEGGEGGSGSMSRGGGDSASSSSSSSSVAAVVARPAQQTAACKPSKTRKCPPPDRVIHANPYINNLPAGRPIKIRQLVRVNQEITEHTAAVRARAKTPNGKAELDAEEELAAQPCTSRSDCPAGRLCAGGKCVCPVLYSGDANCTSHVDVADWCIKPVTDMGFAEFAKVRMTTSALSHISGSRGDLNTKAKFDTCAVVGSSGDLLKKKYGAEIDAHTAVIRFNDAPTRGKEEYVGSKTTLRLQNRYYCGFTEHPGEMCMHYTQDPIHYCEDWKQCKVLSPSARTLLYIFQYWRVSRPPPPRDPGRPNAKLSAGFYGIALAAHMCGSVDVYGFRAADNHYYKKQPKIDPNGKSKSDNCGRWGCGKDKPFKLRHMWSYERRCIDTMREGKIPNVRVHD